MPIGKFNHNIDAKGRVFVPARFRPELGNRFTIFKSPTENCIRAYNEENWIKYKKKLAKIKDLKNNLRRMIFSSSYEVETDSQGRILIPSELLEMTDISDKAVIVGMDRWVEIWEPKEYDKVYGAGDAESLYEMAAYLDSDDDCDDDF
ncbi:MAG: cell division/cell wall cluster transcriptional repressor MraZ [Clostridia bacterium]|nr:cell division/cell wall cluster transcriptional repressor MraZ [Oscillospiraceae bacterium]MBQ6796865.1 cell division/cell wall cluster transcriptional repressor MraZ [Clostridia bacterium]